MPPGEVAAAGTRGGAAGMLESGCSVKEEDLPPPRSCAEIPSELRGNSAINPEFPLPFAKVEGWVAERRRNRLSMTQKHLNITQRLACSEEGMGGEKQERPTSQKSPCL